MNYRPAIALNAIPVQPPQGQPFSIRQPPPAPYQPARPTPFSRVGQARQAPSKVAFGLRMEETASGIVVSYLYRGGPAERAGLEVGDRIETVDGQAVLSSRSYDAVLGRLFVGGSVNVEVTRNGSRRTMPVEARDSAEVFRTACDAGDTEGCYSIGNRLRDGSGVPERLFLKACEATVPVGCFNLGVIYPKGDGVARDLDRSRRYYELACLLGHAEGCEQAEAAARRKP